MDTAETAESAATAEKVEKVETVKEEKTVEAPKDEKMDTGEVKEKKAEPEPDFQMLSNPARVLPQQVRGCGTYCIRTINSVRGKF